MTGAGDGVGFERSGFGLGFFSFFFFKADEKKKEAGFDVRNRARRIKEPKVGFNKKR